MWNTISTVKDIDDFMCSYGNFHDSCIKELRYISGAFVGDDLSMNPFNNTRTVDIIFQRQYTNPMTIVMRFIDVITMHLSPLDCDFTCEIHDASMFIVEENIYWADSQEAKNMLHGYKGTWICAKKVEWRAIDDCVEDNNNMFAAKYE